MEFAQASTIGAFAGAKQACWEQACWQQQCSPSKGSLASSYDSGLKAYSDGDDLLLGEDQAAWAHACGQENALQRTQSTCTSFPTPTGQGSCGDRVSKSAADAGVSRSSALTEGPKARAPGVLISSDLLMMIRNEQQREADLAPHASYLEHHASDNNPDGFITPQMRMIVTSWMCEVAAEFRLQQETLFLAVALLDRFLSASKAVPRTVLQLVAVSCIFLASKQEEVAHPSVEELTDIAANCFSKEDLLRMEMILLDSFTWHIKTPTAYSQLHLLCQGLQARLSPAVTATAAYLTELSLLEYSALHYPASVVAGSAVLLAQATHQASPAWEAVCDLLGYQPSDLAACMQTLLRLQHEALAAHVSEAHQPLLFVRSKYSSGAWLAAAANQQLLQAPPAAPAWEDAMPSDDSDVLMA